MARRKRNWVDGACYHITHRCHGRKFLFRFEKYRDFYVRTLYQAQRRYRIAVLNYVVTSNHIHLLLTSSKGENISSALQYLHGAVAQFHNKERTEEGSFWSNRFHSTRVQSGAHLGRCLFYIDLNMVRAKVVRHPSKWRHCGHHELIKPRERYRVVDRKRLCQKLGVDVDCQFLDWYRKTLRCKIANLQPREDYWSKALAVGDPDWLKGSLRKCGPNVSRFMRSMIQIGRILKYIS
jgi:putative transposase